MNYLDLLRAQFNDHFDLREKRVGIHQLIVPLYHEDGDMVDIFLQELTPDTIRICDFGLTLMRLSYTFDLDSQHKRKIFDRLLAENHLCEENGNISLDVPVSSLYGGVLQFAQGLAKVASISLFKRETVRNLFREQLHQFVFESLLQFNPIDHYFPIPEREDLEVEICLKLERRPLFLFPVLDSNSARLATIACLEFQRQKVAFQSCIIHEDFNNLPTKDVSRVTSAADKQFVSLQNFQEQAENYILREAA